MSTFSRSANNLSTIKIKKKKRWWSALQSLWADKTNLLIQAKLYLA